MAQDFIPGNIDPWAGPTDPDAVARYLRRARHQVHGEPGDACGCWSRDCAECGARLADGKRPRKGEVRASALRHDAMVQQAKEAWHAKAVTVSVSA